MSLTETQSLIVNTKGNLIVMASAGTGKTYTMVKKIEKEIKENHTHKVVAAITFTIKAAREIKERIKVDVSRHYIGTNNSFVINEIIKPFIKDVYGMEYAREIGTNYSRKIHAFDEGLKILKEEGVLISYDDNDKNFIFELALKILEKSKACRLYLQAKYFKFYIDEYQDCDRDMHKLFMFLVDELQIEMFCVGDEKQSIYMWRGAYPEAFRSIKEKCTFNCIAMFENFRSCQQIQNYSNLLFEETNSQYKAITNLDKILFIKTNNTNWQKAVSNHIEHSKTLALLRYKKQMSKNVAEILTENGLETVYIPPIPVAEISTKDAWVYNSIAKIIILDKYSVYDFILEMPFEIKKEIDMLNKHIKAILKSINDYEQFSLAVAKLLEHLGYENNNYHIKKLYDTISDTQYHSAFKIEDYKKVSMTFHSSKGLEYDQVIVFTEDYSLNTEESIYNHYVAVTRAKSKLIIVDYGNERFIHNLNTILERKGLELEDVMTIIE